MNLPTNIQFWDRFFSYRDPSIIPNSVLKRAADMASSWEEGLIGTLRPDAIPAIQESHFLDAWTDGVTQTASSDEVSFENAIGELHPDGAPEGETADSEVQEDYDDDMAACFQVARDLWIKYRTPAPGPVTVTLDEEDRIELGHMLRARGGSDLKVKLEAVLIELQKAAGVSVRS